MIAALLFAIVERSVTPAPGANRLEPDAALLSGAAPLRYSVTEHGGRPAYRLTGGLEDFRLRDADGKEHPYLLVAPRTREPQWRAASTRPIAATKTSSGFEADLGSAVDSDRLRIDGIASPFMKRLRVEGSGDRTRWTVLSAEATIFDLPEQQLKNIEVSFDAGVFRYLRVTWDDRSSARVAPLGDVSARMHAEGSATSQTRIPIAFRSVSSETSKSRYRLQLPGPHLPVIAIEITAANPNVFRDAAVTEGRFSGSTVEPVPLGSGKLRRAAREEGVAEEMAIPISLPLSPDLHLVVDDGNNPSLDIRRIDAVLAPLPWIYFESAAAALTASYGDASRKAARYDLEAKRAAAENSTTAFATWGRLQNAPAVREIAVLTPIAGGAVDRKDFQFARAIAPGAHGLTSLLLDADVLARSHALRDVRITNAASQQIPYVVERRDAPTQIALRVPQRSRGEGAHSVYRFELPYDSLPEGTRLVITTNAHVFERSVTLSRSAEDSRGREKEVIAAETWRSADLESSPPPLLFTASLSGTRSVELDLDEGDNAPLTIKSAQLLLPSCALRFISPGGPLTLLYGNATTDSPRYDLAILAPRLFDQSARDISLTQAAPMVATPSAGLERKIFWGVIVAAVVALLMTLSKLLSGASSTTS